MRKFKSLTAFAAAFALLAVAVPDPSLAATGPAFSWVAPRLGPQVSGVVFVKGTAVAPAGSYIKQWCLTINNVPLASDAALGVDGAGATNFLDHNYDGHGGGATFDASTGCYNLSSSIDSGALSIDTTAWADDTYTLEMTVTDSLGRSSMSAPASIIVTNAAPTVSWLSPSQLEVRSGVLTFEATATPDPAGTASIKKWCLTKNGAPVATDYALDVAGATKPNYLNAHLTGDQPAIFDAITGCYNSAASITSGTFAADTTAWPDGLTDFQITVTDSSNRSTASEVRTIGSANKPPKFQWMSPLTATTHASTVRFSGLAAADSAGTATVKTWCLKIDGKLPGDVSAGINAFLDVQDNLGSYDSATGCFADGQGALTSGSMGLDFTWLLADAERNSAKRTADLQVTVTDSSGRSSNSGILTAAAYLGQLSFSVANNVEIAPSAYAPTPQVVPGSATASAVSVTWSAAPAGSAATGYLARTSADGGATWATTDLTTNRLDLTGLRASSATLVQVAVKTANGTGPFGPAVVAATAGLHTQRLVVLDASGAPVSGGAVTFAMKVGAGRSASALGLTSAGVIDFARAPAGTAEVTITAAKLADGVYVSGTTQVVFGSGTATVRLPEHSPAKTTFKPRLASAQVNVAGVTIVSNRSFTRLEADNEFVFEVRWAGNPNGYDTFTASGLTNDLGVYEVEGFAGNIGVDTVKATYDAHRSQHAVQTEVPFSPGLVLIPIDSVPVLVADSPVVNATAGMIANVLLSTNAFGGSDQVASENVRLIAPAGAKPATCGPSRARSVLQGVTDANGKVKLKICATESGKYTFASDRTLAMGSVTLHVAKAKPMAPRALNLTSSSPGALATSWAAPEYLGGAKLNYYLVTLKSKAGGKAIVKKVTSRNLKFTGLAHATEYSVFVVAVTKYGSSTAVVGVGGVA
jgi:uncharacterized protein YdbL (DUF1318 family)